MSRQILVTSALPYANGPLHLGHIIEAVQTDLWVRFQRMRGHDCLYVCAEDAHGAPIMIKAQTEGISPEKLIEGVAALHRADYEGFMIGHDQFHTTHSPESKYFTDLMYERLRAAGHISQRSVRQAYDETKGMFLADRYVRGGCPKCGAPDQYGDSCEICGATYSPFDLVNPISTLSNTVPAWRESDHLFFALGNFENMLREWVDSGSLQTAVRAKLEEWFSVGLQDWDISRDAPYFGFEIPGSSGKYFYVWFDATIGYLGSFKALCEKIGLDVNTYLKPDSKTELHHFIGKDISYFHTLFWPAVLHGSGMRRPTGVHVHGFLTINGVKMSKSRGTFITAKRYLALLPPESLRYYFAAKLGPGIDDIDLALNDFSARVNSDLIGKLVNIASRCSGFVARSGGTLSKELADPNLYNAFTAVSERIAELYEARDYAQAMREIMLLADRANQYIDIHKPWALTKDLSKSTEVLSVATQGINLFRVLMVYLAPVLPNIAIKASLFLGVPLTKWDEIKMPLLGSALAKYEPLAVRLDPKIVAGLIDSSPQTHLNTTDTVNIIAQNKNILIQNEKQASALVTIDDFKKIDLRIAKITKAEIVDGSDKLLKLTLVLGSETRQVLSGIRKSYTPEILIGRHVVLIANLMPRKMRFGISEGMILCASDTNDRIYLLSADEGATSNLPVS
ncbi:MAG: methionine--tRNA ligase [Gammaproteobacteria bacterium]|nr:methionine--tRNA ligase [Gammaproteobacteria bacterium]